MEELIFFFFVGFFAQLVDGALGMAYGLISTTMLLSLGIPPAVASATTHAAECFTTGFSAIAHHQFGNINGRLFRWLLIPGILGSIGGVYLLVHIDPAIIKPLISIYLMTMGVVILVKAFCEFPPKRVTDHLIPLGLFGGFMDAVGGGGWGPVVSSNLLARGNDARTTIGSVNACEFFIALIATAAFFFNQIELSWQPIVALALGGAVSAPLGAWLCRHLPSKVLLGIVGCLIIILSFRLFWLGFLGL